MFRCTQMLAAVESTSFMNTFDDSESVVLVIKSLLFDYSDISLMGFTVSWIAICFGVEISSYKELDESKTRQLLHDVRNFMKSNGRSGWEVTAAKNLRTGCGKPLPKVKGNESLVPAEWSGLTDVELVRAILTMIYSE